MPGGDRSGPSGQGPMTGRGAGYCGPNDSAGFTTAGFGRGGRGLGRRNFSRGWGNRFRAPFGQGRSWFGSAPAMTQEQEQEMLKAQAREMQSALDAINDRLNKIEP